MKQLLALILVLICFSCGSKRKIITKKDRNEETEVPVKSDAPDRTIEDVKSDRPVITSTESYIETFKDIAISEMELYSIPASITLAQGILESGSGKGRLAVKANNHFGIKCHDWTGARIYHDDDRSQECFRKYKNPSQSFRDHSEFLAKRKRYSKLFNLSMKDYKGWARELRRAGYATDKRYPQKLISLIERYDLDKYDRKSAGISAAAKREHIVMAGDTLYSISKRYGVSVEQIKSLNKLSGNDIDIGQVLIISSAE
ncbi:MAG: LysM peptidoglycan-binding domain-containing protein [Flavobacteriaceae bacterium]|nr:glucosaminidase domain-containing protein [Bacteroidia bacterium]NNF81372.1 LysM peptidoglycan-binding domain-containing protein [Flavobacteriaceae bacterium]NNK54149.1 LysM peptidoglycan-binding domain-containing protein [Flavobacteriaceae bacterium]NNL81670.1 LysM peptidoglycan-binding domain-containing protein [Flavobacteriaceae bacterium]